MSTAHYEDTEPRSQAAPEEYHKRAAEQQAFD